MRNAHGGPLGLGSGGAGGRRLREICTADGSGFRDVHGRWEGSKTTALMPLIVNYTATDLSGISDAEVAAKEELEE